ncbi:hypothetical protein PGT21_037144 [Puccinia graminis f. sp. tritici]|uniref:Amidohydrolase-related domain-containing protein n=2 Tax=Puccinia graminis f. sp. tritici TaxID=56615 RepID=E3L2S6_PUCGT|nr:uncharacterized protein PGTG_17041 [Puccinia graminis f. sp. tritici CRL 75-36-700-3]EFP90842.2 hypothetical protein PGTG_17041 [Puccinia graminis f. sp. tritici CRL 75-36-700-3]KAA1077117.1 hypothetical protein PGTUg99_004643 [Puccinia graminis f. sp. tritici]KAA1115594.1 hypothetical protein PGT21_037144 [Puccinia graminis f. sp. tritici]
MPKKPPPHLPLQAFSSNPASSEQQANQLLTRRVPLVAIDAHVFLPEDSEAGHSRTSAKLWHDSIQPFYPEQITSAGDHQQAHSHQTTTQFKGFIHIHQQPAWLLEQTPDDPQQAAQLSSKRWETESQNILRIDKELVEIQMAPPLGQVIWAPLHQGPSVLGSYLDQLSNLSIRICGCCHLIERKSTTRNVSLVDPEFIESLKLLGERGLSVELMVDGNHERSARAILDEVLECVSAVRRGQDSKSETKFVLCQMGMPEMISTQSLVPSSASYSSILSRLFSLSLFSDFHIKLSGLPLILEEELNKRACKRFLQSHRPNPRRDLEPSTPVAVHEDEDGGKQETDRDALAQGESAWREVKKRIKFYLEPILEAFGDHRLIYASGFPYYDVPQVSSPADKATGRYEYQFEIFRECLTEFGLENGALDNVFGLNAQRCYSV